MMQSFSEKFDFTWWQHQLLIKATSTISKGTNSSSANNQSPSYVDITLKSSSHQPFVSALVKQSKLTRLNQSSVLVEVKQSINSSRIQLNDEVLQEDFNNLWIGSRLFEFDDWKEIAKVLEEMFNTKVIINPC